MMVNVTAKKRFILIRAFIIVLRLRWGYGCKQSDETTDALAQLAAVRDARENTMHASLYAPFNVVTGVFAV